MRRFPDGRCGLASPCWERSRSAVPTSSHHQLDQIVHTFRVLEPTSVLDIGIGFGKYGLLAREYLDVSGHEHDRQYGDFRTRIDGVEAFAEYVLPHHRSIYDHIYVGNALDVVPKLEHHYGLVLLIDVLEHFSRDEGLSLLNALAEHAENILVSVPCPYMEQGGDAYGNEYERHRYEWGRGDFTFLTPRMTMQNVHSLITVWGKGVNELKRQYTIGMALHRTVSRHFPALLEFYRSLKPRHRASA